MAAVAHNPQFAAKVGIPQKVGEDFNAADEAKKRMMKKSPMQKLMDMGPKGQ